MKPTRPHLDSEHIEQFNRSGAVAILATADRHGRPHVSVVSWLRILDPRHIALALDRRTQHFANVSVNPRVSLSLMSDQVILAISGTVEISREQMEATPWETAHITIDVDLVVDQTLPGVTFVAPSYSYPESKANRTEVESKVLAELSKRATARKHRVTIVDDGPHIR